MNCPICLVELFAHRRQGVEIDMCPKCRGVWLDRGELDKVIERSEGRFNDRDSDDHDHSYPSHDSRDSRGKRGWWSELFD